MSRALPVFAQDPVKEARLAAVGRSCGECSACCSALEIPARALRGHGFIGSKPAGQPCTKLAPTGGCSIYPGRPRICRSFSCAWLLGFKGMEEQDRPDRSRILPFVQDPMVVAGLPAEARQREAYWMTIMLGKGVDSYQVAGLVGALAGKGFGLMIDTVPASPRCRVVMPRWPHQPGFGTEMPWEL